MQPNSLWRFSPRGQTHLIRAIGDPVRQPDPNRPENVPSPTGLTYCNKLVDPELQHVEFRGLTDGHWGQVTCYRCFKARFNLLKKKWQYDTRYLSNPRKIQSHEAYQEIIRMGLRALPLIIKELETGPAFWWEALRQLTKENPVTAAMAGDQEQIRQAWLAWWERGYIGGR